MRWIDDYATPGASGEQRTRSGFLCLPKTIKGETRWLESAEWTEQFGGSSSRWNGWRAVAWGDAVDSFWRGFRA